jgi:streptogramin lyase
MFEKVIRNHRTSQRMKPTNVRLTVEELEGRCLLSSGFAPLGGITSGPDGYIWFLEQDRLGRIDPHTGVIQEFAQGIRPDLSCSPSLVQNIIAEAPDGSIWFLSNNQVTRFNPSTNALATFNLSAGNTPLDSIIVGSDGVVWVLEERIQVEWADGIAREFGIARIDPAAGSVQDYGMGQIQGHAGGVISPWGIGFAPDGNIWIDTWMLPLQEMDPTTGVIQGPPPVGPSIVAELAPLPPQPAMLSPAPPPSPWWEDRVATSKVASDGSYWSFGVIGPGYWAINGYYPSTGMQKQFALADEGPIQLTPGPDGNIWYTYVTTLSGPGGAPVYSVGSLNPTTGTFESFSAATPSQAPPSTGATGTTLSTTAGFDLVGAVASFTPQTPIASPGQAYQVTINWGDGTTSSIVLTVTQNGTYDVIGEHTYQSAGTYNIQVTIGTFDPANPLGDNPITVFSTANVNPFSMSM